MSTLEEQVAERKREAERKGIRGSAFRIACYLGKQTAEDTHVFSKPPFTIKYCGGFQSSADGVMPYLEVQIVHNDKTVFEMNGNGITSYIPGAWEKRLGALDKSAKRRQAEKDRTDEAERKTKQADKEQTVRSRFGL